MTTRSTARRALATSRIGDVIGRMTHGSRVVDVIRGATVDPVLATWRSWTAGSTVGDAAISARTGLTRLATGARTVDLLGAIGRWTRRSALYRWLTAEPEPDVIVIDLRETVTIRPFLIALDESIGLLLLGRRTSVVRAAIGAASRRLRAAPIRVVSFAVLFALLLSAVLGAVLGTLDTTGIWVRGVGAALALAGTRVDHSWETIRESRPARLAVALLEPPEPPEPTEPPDRAGERKDDRHADDPCRE